MLGDNRILMNRGAVKEALQEYLSKRFAEGHVPVVMDWDFMADDYDRNKQEIKIEIRDPHTFLDKGEKT